MAKQKPPAEDAEHEVFYKSPGANPGGHGRTYDWAHAKDADEKAALMDQGYFPDLLVAYEKAGKPVPPRQRAKPPEGEEWERDPISGGPVAVKPAAPADGPPARSLADVQTALSKLKEAKDAKAVTAVLKAFDVTAAPKLDPSQYDAVIAAAEKAQAE